MRNSFLIDSQCRSQLRFIAEGLTLISVRFCAARMDLFDLQSLRLNGRVLTSSLDFCSLKAIKYYLINHKVSVNRRENLVCVISCDRNYRLSTEKLKRRRVSRRRVAKILFSCENLSEFQPSSLQSDNSKRSPPHFLLVSK